MLIFGRKANCFVGLALWLNFIGSSHSQPATKGKAVGSKKVRPKKAIRVPKKPLTKLPTTKGDSALNQPASSKREIVLRKQQNAVFKKLKPGKIVKGKLVIPGIVGKGDPAIDRMLDKGEAALKIKRYDIALEIFDGSLLHPEKESPLQFSRRHMGRATARFHQKGCAAAYEDLRLAALDPQNTADVNYLTALCLVENNRLKKAHNLFNDFVQNQHPKYQDPSRLYLGTIAEKEEKWDDAENYYKDTIDFADDKLIVDIAKQKLQNLELKKAAATFEGKVLSVVGVASFGYDSNVVGLPANVSPADSGYTKVDSTNSMGLASINLNNIFIKKVSHKVHYNFMAMHYFTPSLSKSYDMQLHDIGTNVDFNINKTNNGGLAAGYSMVYLGELGKSTKYLTIINSEFKWLKDFPLADKPDTALTTTFKYGLTKPVKDADPATAAKTDSTASAYAVSTRYNYLYKAPVVFGPGLDVEYRPSKGTENSYFSSSLMGHYDMPVGPETWKLTTTQELSGQYTTYYASDAKRKDWIFKYNASIGRPLTGWLELRFSLMQKFSTSNVATFKSRQTQCTLTLSGLY